MKRVFAIAFAALVGFLASAVSAAEIQCAGGTDAAIESGMKDLVVWTNEAGLESVGNSPGITSGTDDNVELSISVERALKDCNGFTWTVELVLPVGFEMKDDEPATQGPLRKTDTATFEVHVEDHSWESRVLGVTKGEHRASRGLFVVQVMPTGSTTPHTIDSGDAQGRYFFPVKFFVRHRTK